MMNDSTRHNQTLFDIKRNSVVVAFNSLRHIFSNMSIFLMPSVVEDYDKAHDLLLAINANFANNQQVDFDNMLQNFKKLDLIFESLAAHIDQMLDNSLDCILPLNHYAIMKQTCVLSWRLLQIKEKKRKFEKNISRDQSINLREYNELITKFTNEIIELWQKYKQLLDDSVENENENENESVSLDMTLINKAFLAIKRVGGCRWLLDAKSDTLKIFLGRLIIVDKQNIIFDDLCKLYENYLALILNKKSDKLKGFFLDKYSFAYKMQQKLLRDDIWYSHLTRLANQLTVPPSRSVLYAFEVKKIIYSIKEQFYLQFYRDLDQCRMQVILGLEKLVAQGYVDAEAALDKLKRDYIYAQEKIKSFADAMQSYGWSAGILSSILRFWTETHYFKSAKNFFSMANEYTSNDFANNSLLATKLSNGFIDSFSAIFSLSIFGIDIYSSKWFGMTFSVASVLSKFMTPSVVWFAGLTDVLSLNIDKAIAAMPLYDWFLRLFINLAINTHKYGVNSGIIGYFTGSFIVGSICQLLSLHLFDMITLSSNNDNVQSHKKQFARAVVSNLGFFGGSKIWNRVYPCLRSVRWNVSDEELLNSVKLCLNDKEHCRKLALDVLKLPENVTRDEIKKQYRFLVKQLHPDVAKVENTVDQYISLNRAFEALKAVMKGEQEKVRTSYRLPLQLLSCTQ